MIRSLKSQISCDSFHSSILRSKTVLLSLTHDDARRPTSPSDARRPTSPPTRLALPRRRQPPTPTETASPDLSLSDLYVFLSPDLSLSLTTLFLRSVRSISDGNASLTRLGRVSVALLRKKRRFAVLGGIRHPHARFLQLRFGDLIFSFSLYWCGISYSLFFLK